MSEHVSPAVLVSAAVLSSDRAEQPLLQSIVEVARAIFGAAASSVVLLDESDGCLVFEAVSGEGEDFLPGKRFPATEGVAGWVLASAESLIVDDLASNPVFARGVAESTGYVPTSLMAAPLLHADHVIGALEVLDRTADSRGELADVELLRLFANQAALSLQVVLRGRSAGRVFDERPEYGSVVGILDAIDRLSASDRAAADQILEGMHQLLERAASSSG
jgi:GAF domain-containing protein